MASKDEENISPTNPVALSMPSKRENLMPATSFESSANNDNDNEEDQRISSQLSDSFYFGMDSMNILSSQENDILMNADPISVKNNKRTFDSLLEEKSGESHVISHDSDASVSKKINSMTSSAVNQAETQNIQLSSFSFKPVKRKTRKVMYKITNEKEINSSGNKKARHDSSTHASQSMSSQKATIVATERIHSGPSKTTRWRKKKPTREASLPKNIGPPLNPVGIFSNFRIFFIPNNIDKVRLRLLKEKVIEKGGQVVDGEFDASTTHVITALQGQRILEILGILENNVPQYEKLVDINSHIVKTSDVLDTQQIEKSVHDNDENKRNDNYIKKKQRQESMSPKRRSSSPPSVTPEVSALTYESSPTVSDVISGGDDPLLEMIAETKCLGFLLEDDDDESQSVQSEMSDSEDEFAESSTQNEVNLKVNKKVLSQTQETTSELSPKEAKSFKGFSCMQKHTYGEDDASPNKLIIDKLKVLLDHYQRMKDDWRIISYRKAISAIKRQKEPITSYQEAIEISGIGHRTAEKIVEILDTGNLRRLQHFSKDDEVIEKFSDICGVGPSIAMKWYAKGYRTFDDIIQNVKLTRLQRIGIEYEVTEISKRVEEAACRIDPKLICITVGSYIRGKPTCGDIDILITRNNSDEKENSGSLLKLLNTLREQGLLTHDLTQHQEESSRRYFGICKLHGGKHRRIDLFTVPFNELGAALLSFTGNDIFNRSMRLLARKKKMKLNDHGLYKHISRGRRGDALNEGTLIAQKTEREIFDALGFDNNKYPITKEFLTLLAELKKVCLVNLEGIKFTGDGKMSSILTKRSEYFRKIIEGGWIEDSQQNTGNFDSQRSTKSHIIKEPGNESPSSELSNDKARLNDERDISPKREKVSG
ncbi:28044_t:CDS:10 [Dentiscutata erythropus]|uniref:DNA polymerase lambda n=1 Tax=Dentiscutata erythropus TaxID=1348616 RepID=A0A9N8WH23_9GLOM|nr:28044_t:CDS:10 [Dentiscutata erythropus]